MLYSVISMSRLVRMVDDTPETQDSYRQCRMYMASYACPHFSTRWTGNRGVRPFAQLLREPVPWRAGGQPLEQPLEALGDLGNLEHALSVAARLGGRRGAQVVVGHQRCDGIGHLGGIVGPGHAAAAAFLHRGRREILPRRCDHDGAA